MPRFTSQPTPATVHQGSSHVMPCEVNADLVPFVRWEKDRQSLELNTRLVQLPSGALVISNASEGDAGLYRCLVENVGSSKSSDEVQLQIAPGKRRAKHKNGRNVRINIQSAQESFCCLTGRQYSTTMLREWKPNYRLF